MDVVSSSSSTIRNVAVDGRQQLLEQQKHVRQLAARDATVRAHEQAHAAVGGAHASTPHYQFSAGPNGVRYAVSGHVNIDVSAVAGDPAATMEKMRTVARAALAPAQPSAADRAVAAKASAQAAEARAELANQSEISASLGGTIDVRV
jgi:hypothetical protein